MSVDEPATVGLLTEPYLLEWQVRAIERLQRETDVSIPLVVTNTSDTDYQAESWNDRDRVGLEDLRQFVDLLGTERAWTFVLAERNLGRLFGDEREFWRRHSVENVDAIADADHLECVPQTDGNWNELPAAVVDELGERCDVVIRFGFGLVRGDVLTAPEHGVLSFHPADIRRYRGMGPPAIFHDGRDRAGSTLQRLDESIDGGEIVASDDVSLAGCHTLWEVFDRVAERQIGLLTEGITALQDPSFEPQSIPDEQLGEFYYRRERRTATFAGRVLAKNVAGRLRRRIGRRRSTGDHVESTHDSAD
ncbi:formyltransferase family protein [Natronolimnohabitans innermongolicus]|uniref:Methionyl-tRNA formyltransferase-like protein n=1 Tax=Natronolimnohabitans innermongolicus JCM 12255 TaxID=1227499 RepID=L9XB37_9EURY|nr:formyltransferase family protein [Natronolimnohabitans innermongolicus]ELY58930.1 methionyl-tRNA formyltransferase-like protein [Natronolimnohabitans innermongolicus JCM 12255]